MSIFDKLKRTKDFVIEDGVLVRYTGDSSAVVIPDGVTRIGNDVFCANKEIKSVVIPEGVTEIGDRVFSYCTSLESVSLPDSLRQIGTEAFSNVRGLADEDGFVIICGVLFGYFGDSRHIIVPKGVKRIESRALAHKQCVRIDIPKGVTSIGFEAFADCAFLGTVDVSSTVKSIGVGAFSRCPSLRNVRLPIGLSEIKTRTFSECMSLRNITIPEGVTTLGEQVFYDCKRLINAEIPDSVTEIGEACFGNCTSLELDKLPSRLMVIKSETFASCRSLNISVFPPCLTTIESQAFKGCHNLDTIILPPTLTSIGRQAFYGCGSKRSTEIMRISIPDSVQSIGEEAFGDKVLLNTQMVIKNPDLIPEIYMLAASAGLAEIYADCTDVVKDRFFSYMKRHSVLMVDMAVNGMRGGSGTRLLKILLDNDCLVPEMVDYYMQKATEADKLDAKAMLLSHQHRGNFGFLSDFTLDDDIGGEIKDKTFVIDERDSNYPGMRERVLRDDSIKNRLKRCGAILATTVTEDTDYVISNDDTLNSETIVVARSLGIKVITEKMFLEKWK